MIIIAFLQLPDPLGQDEDLEDLNHLTDLVGPELAGMVSNPSIAQRVKTTITSSSTGSASNPSNNSDMPSDISDLSSSDLLQTLPGVDIDRMFADLQAEQNQPEVSLTSHERIFAGF
jgi:hypothetical protein